ncbi:hypothetical protein [Streptomyces europaeiscabiei]|uniref:hypothetical protein n=1 Tax=Streptomyces europaeiscabiei TaxID=146819 RepID=UPI0038F7A1CB
MKPLVLGAVLALVWLLFGPPPVTVTAMLPVLVEPVTIAFALGLAARPYVARRGWLR